MVSAATSRRHSLSVRIQISRMIVALYEVRNNRNVGHVGSEVDPNQARRWRCLLPPDRRRSPRGRQRGVRFVVRAKARPVLLLSARSDPRTGDLFALRLLRPLVAQI